MPFFIAVYDVDRRRVAKMLKLMRRYLTWVQNSVLEGELTESKFQTLRHEAAKLMGEGDSVIFYRLREERYADRIVLGQERGENSRFL